ncbi:uncharacterized protein LAESUDRAFT_722386 [Laetiporus sulphureus 93-53]|uniref:mRNA cap guanine-N(7) methyltransferase n=1 Tax=Laetiporus sulphureus 93-53 TaxID=1314785 RepID=A0A165FUA6_9APHY|nr:uncharacterized protein LAESUDRAFT_722386 [Laetiporus sulphureus 93-53]KZT09419.1 hypothetical protein LAESUDRAFT_722386 [Laetiporus sulphureus 93-53]
MQAAARRAPRARRPRLSLSFSPSSSSSSSSPSLPTLWLQYVQPARSARYSRQPLFPAVRHGNHCQIIAIMPAFDPVRDAVLNSPSIPPSLHSTPRMHIDLPLSSYPSSSSATSNTPSSSGAGYAPSSSSASTPLTRRATDLSVLLNSDPPSQDTPLFTPVTPRPPIKLSHLLLPTDSPASMSVSDEQDELSNLAPLRRRSESSSSSSIQEGSYFTWHGSSSSKAPVLAGSPRLALPGSLPTHQAHSGPSTLNNSVPVIRSPVAPTLSNIVSPTNSYPASSTSRPSSSHSVSSDTSAVSMPVLGGLNAPRRPSYDQPTVHSRTPAMPPPPQPRSSTPPSMTPVQLPEAKSMAHIGRSSIQNAFAQETDIMNPPPAFTSAASQNSQHTASPASSELKQRAKPSSSPISAPRTPILPPKPSLNPSSSMSFNSSLPSASSLPPKPDRPEGTDAGPPSSNMFTIKRSKVPYNPINRRTPAGSVLVPLSSTEMERYRNFPGGVGTMILRKRKREDAEKGTSPGVKKDHADVDWARGRGEMTSQKRDSEDMEDDGRKKRRRTGDVGLVVEHYNARPDVGVSQRQESPIIGLKSFNNWVKSVLITRFAHPALVADSEARGSLRGRVLDIGCGKGGDLTKWSKARIREYVGIDIAAISVEQARLRHMSLRGGPRFAASFFALDCYEHDLHDGLPPALLARPFDVVSMQFCMHYAFESEKKARCMLKNVADNLRSGGIFIGTIPDSTQLMDRLDSLPPNAEELSWGNSVYKVRFEDRAHRPLFGHRYWFFLRDAVDDVPEYVVQWDNFIKLAAEYGLRCVYKKEFHQVFEEHHTHPEFGPLLERMKVVDADGESQMDEDQWEAANIYVAFAFEKR